LKAHCILHNILGMYRTPKRVAGGGGAARRAVLRLAWSLFRREWRQQLLILALVIVAVSASVVGSAVAINAPLPSNSGFGTARYAATISGSNLHPGADIAYVKHLFGRIDVIENEGLRVPGSTSTYELRAQNPSGPYGRPMLSLVSGRYPSAASQVAVTPGLASDFELRVGGTFETGSITRRVVGIVENPQDLLDEFALVEPGEVRSPTQVTMLFDVPAGKPLPRALTGSALRGPGGLIQLSAASTNPVNPETISLAALTLGMVLIALVAIGGFTVITQRRLRSIAMLASIGATDEHTGFLVRANGVMVGVVGALVGSIVGLLLWFAYRPHLEQSAHHLIGVFALPWVTLVAAIVLSTVATYLGAAQPARALKGLSVVAALSGRPAPPRQIHRSALPGVALLVVAFLLLGYSGSTNGGSGDGGTPELVLGIIALVPAIILLAPFCLSGLGRLARRTPVAVRIALRDLSRYRARSAPALAAISVGVMVAVIIVTLAQARYSNVWDRIGPNLTSNQLVAYSSGRTSPVQPSPGELRSQAKTAAHIGASLGALHVVALESTTASLENDGGSHEIGTIYVATPQLLHVFGIGRSEVNPTADILTSRAGLSRTSGIELTWCRPSGTSPKAIGRPVGARAGTLCTAPSTVRNPGIQQMGLLPLGTSAPNTVITEHAVHAFGLTATMATVGWLIETPEPLTAAQIHGAQASAAAADMSIETRNDQPTSFEVIGWATATGIAIALCILAMCVGLIRSETAGDLRTLAATGASSYTRRTLTAATAGALGLFGGILGTFVGYVGVVGWLRDNSVNGGLASLASVPLVDLLLLSLGLPMAAAVAGWLLAGREPPAISRQPID
jgi:putative ABC transport system permease protein